MRTTGGLDVPRLGEGGGPYTRTKPEHRTSNGTRSEHRWVRAEDVCVGDRLMGHQGGIYTVLGTDWTADHHIALTVKAPSGTIRTWIRSPRFSIDRP